MARALVKTAGQTPRNLIINGNFDFWQRGTSFPAIISSAYSADRFQYNKNGTMVHTVSRDTSVPTFVQSGFQSLYSYKALITTPQASIGAGEFCAAQYRMEGLDYAQAYGKTMRLQFWVRNTITGTYSVSFRNNAANRSYIATYTINASDTWEKKTIDLTMDTVGTWSFDNTGSLIILFAIACGTTFQTASLNTWQAGNFLAASTQVNGVASGTPSFQLAQVMFTQGNYLQDTSLTFIRAGDTIEDEFAMCQRYYEKSYLPDIAPGTGGGFATVSTIYHFTASTGGGVYVGISPYRVPKRVNATATTYGAAGGINSITLSGTGDIAATTDNASQYGHSVIATAARTSGNVVGWHWTADAEL